MNIFVWSTIVLTIWSVISGFVGVIVGAKLAARSTHEQWIRDKKAAECKEVIESITKAYLITLREKSPGALTSPEAQRARDDAETASHEIIASQVFIAKELEKADIGTRWARAQRVFEGRGGTEYINKFTESYRAIVKDILSITEGMVKA